MDTDEMKETEALVKEMLDFLNSSSDDEKGDEKDSKPLKEERPEDILAKKIQLVKNMELWSSRGPAEGVLSDPVWKYNGNISKSEQQSYDNTWNAKLEANCRRNLTPSAASSTYTHEANRALPGDSIGQLASGSNEYMRTRKSYSALGREDIINFPKNLSPNLGASPKSAASTLFENNVHLGSSFNPRAYDRGLYRTPPNVNYPNYNLAAGGSSSTAFHQMRSGLQSTMHPTGGSNSAASGSYGMYMRNNYTYPPPGPPPTAPQPLFYNPQQSPGRNFVPNKLPSPPGLVYSNPMLRPNPQHFPSSIYNETPILTGCGTAGAANSSTTGIYERLVYAQMLQQQLYQQQQAAAVAAMYQYRQRPRTSSLASLEVARSIAALASSDASFTAADEKPPSTTQSE